MDHESLIRAGASAPALRKESLRQRVVRGSAIVAVGSGSEQALRFLRNMVVTRLLLPDQVGIMAIILAINLALESFTDVGIREAIIQHPESKQKDYLNGAFWFSVVRSLVLASTGMLLASFLCGFYHIEHHEGLMRLSFLSIVFNGAMSPRAGIALKEMRYGVWVGIMQGAAFFGILCTLVLVYRMHTVEALIIGYVLEAFLRMFFSYLLCPFMPGLKTTREHRNALFSFAKGMAGIPLLNFIFLQADLFVLGKLVPTAVIGLYGMAGSLAGIPTLLVSIFINPIMTPVFSSIRNDPGRVNDALIRATSLLAILGFPLCVAVAVCGKEVMTIVYGAPYGAAGTAFSVLFVASFLRTIASPVSTAYVGLGRPELNRTFTFVRTLLFIIIIYPAARFGGMAGAAAAGAITMAISWFFQPHTMKLLTGLKTSRYRDALLTGLPGTVITLVGGAAVFLVHGPLLRIGIAATACALGLLFSVDKIRVIVAPKALSPSDGGTL
jgi:O-antigen/teichoic acid export membrane protein